MPNRRLPVGAEPLDDGTTAFRVWAPRCRRVEVAVEGGPTVSLEAEQRGYFSGVVEAGVGRRYRYRLDGSAERPDPASRFQPEGPHGPSEIVDPGYAWTDRHWPGVGRQGQVIYEMHVGTFTREGSYASAARELGRLRDLGVTLIEIMPLADFPGRFGWGYDGVNLYAPTRLYGRPEDLRALINDAHAAGIGVILDVVYNHFGPSGNYLGDFAEQYLSRRHLSEWGGSPNFDDEGCTEVRAWVLANARYWIEEFHFDGLRLDATQQIFDDSPEHIVAAIIREARAAAGGRSLYLTAENEPQDVRLIAAPGDGGYGADSMWNDDFHHAAAVALTGRNEAYYTDYRGTPQELVSSVKHGFLYQGQRYEWQGQRRGTWTRGFEASRFVTFLENHDQVANSGRGSRCHALTSPGRYRAMTAVLLLGPQTPMLFQGQEYGSSAPFYYFADHEPGLSAQVADGRRTFLTQFRSLADPAMQRLLPDPGDPATFERCKLAPPADERERGALKLHRDLLRIRRGDPVIVRPEGLDGAVLADEAFVLRFFGPDHDDRLLVVNLGREERLRPAPEPLLAPPPGREWAVRWSSEDPEYGGGGTAPVDGYLNWWLPGHAAVLLGPGKPREPSG